MITVVVLTYNRINTAIKSIKSLVCDPLVSKVIVVDDASEKEDLMILKKFCAKISKIHLVNNKKNLGYSDNLIRSLFLLREEFTEFLFLCESDMLLSKGWGQIIQKAFDLSLNTVCITPMLHTDQFTPHRSERFKKRCLEGIYSIGKDGLPIEIKKPFGTCYNELPNAQTPLRIGKFKLRYVSNSIGTLVFRNNFLQKLPLNKIKKYPVQEDAWLSWACFEYNNYHPKSLGVLDPGLALTFGEVGLHGRHIARNKKWVGSFWWKFEITAFLTKLYHRFRFSFLLRIKKIQNKNAS